MPSHMSTGLRVVLRRCIELAGPIGTVIDVAASDGQWSRIVMQMLPDSSYLLLDAQSEHRRSLERFSRETGAEHVLAAASNRTGTLHFLDDGNLFGGKASREAFEEHDSVVPCVAIDDLLKERRLEGPFLLKLDTHGHELEILDGASNALAHAALVVLETYAFSEVSGYTFDEMCRHMRGLGFRPAGIADVMTRQDGALWQVDIAFLPVTHQVFAHSNYELA